jgi:hypothetical protein
MNAFLKSAVEDVSASLDALLKASSTDQCADDPGEERRRSLEAAVSARIDTVVTVANLLKKSSEAVKRLDPGIKAWRRLMECRPVLAAVEAIQEYSSTQPPNGGESAVARYQTVQVSFRRWQHDLAVIVGEAWNLLETRWRTEAPRLVDDERRAALEKEGKDDETDVGRRQVKSLEDFVALQYLAFIRLVLSHLRHVMIFVALSFTLVLISLNVYSFEPHQSLIWSFTLIFIVTGLMVVSVLAQLHRDPILSRVTGTIGSTLDLRFYLRLVAFGALPLLTLLATHFPSLGHYLVSFLQPSLEALK